MFHKSGNIWYYSSNNSAYSPCTSGFSTDFSNLLCSYSTSATPYYIWTTTIGTTCGGATAYNCEGGFASGSYAVTTCGIWGTCGFSYYYCSSGTLSGSSCVNYKTFSSF